MFKERSLSYDYGENIAPNHNYCISTSATNAVAALAAGYDSLKGILEARAYGRSYANIAFGSYSNVPWAHEKFYSSSNKPPLFNNCDHSKTNGGNYPITACYYGRSDRLYIEYFYRQACSLGVNATVNALSRHHVADIGPAQRSAWATMQPRFEGDVSMINFIIELKDFRSLAKFLLRKPLRKLSNAFQRYKRSAWRKKLDLTKPISELHLANEFALKPLISDVVTITAQMAQVVKENQQNFANSGLERNSRHYSEVFSISENNELSAYSQSRYPHLLWGSNEMLTFNATMEYSYEYNMRSTMDAFIKYWGLGFNAEAIWNAIPFSFLVDYFYGVGRALKLNSRDKNVSLNKVQYCESLLSERTYGGHYKLSRMFGPLVGAGSNVYIPGAGNALYHGAKSSFYTRRVTQPNKGSVLPRIKRPSTKQGWNILALARCFF